MTPTVFVALLTHHTGMGTVGLPEGSPAVNGRPLHLSLHTSEAGAASAVLAALRQEWDTPALGHRGLAYSLGPSSEWAEDRLMAEAEAQGYDLTVHEQPVELSGSTEEEDAAEAAHHEAQAEDRDAERAGQPY